MLKPNLPLFTRSPDFLAAYNQAKNENKVPKVRLVSRTLLKDTPCPCALFRRLLSKFGRSGACTHRGMTRRGCGPTRPRSDETRTLT